MKPLSVSECRCWRSSPALVLIESHRTRSAERKAMPEPGAYGERELTGPEKAAALLLMMGRPPAARLLKQFDQPDLRAVALAAAGLGAIPATTLDRLVEEFAADFSTGADLAHRARRRHPRSRRPCDRRQRALPFADSNPPDRRRGPGVRRSELATRRA